MSSFNYQFIDTTKTENCVYNPEVIPGIRKFIFSFFMRVLD